MENSLRGHSPQISGLLEGLHCGGYFFLELWKLKLDVREEENVIVSLTSYLSYSLSGFVIHKYIFSKMEWNHRQDIDEHWQRCIKLMNHQESRCGVYIYAFIVLAGPYTKSFLFNITLHRTSHCHWAMLETAHFLCFDLGMNISCHISHKSVNIFLYLNTDRAVSSLQACDQTSDLLWNFWESSLIKNLSQFITKGNSGEWVHKCITSNACVWGLPAVKMSRTHWGTQHHLHLRKLWRIVLVWA